MTIPASSSKKPSGSHSDNQVSNSETPSTSATDAHSKVNPGPASRNAGQASVPFNDRYTADLNRRSNNEDLASRVHLPPPGEVSPRDYAKASGKSVSPEISPADAKDPALGSGHGKRPREEVRGGSSSPGNPLRKQAKLSGPASQLLDDNLLPRYITREGSPKTPEITNRLQSGISAEQGSPGTPATASMTQPAIAPDNSVIRPLTRWSLPISLSDQWLDGRRRRLHVKTHGYEFGLGTEESAANYQLAVDFFQKPLQDCEEVIEIGRIEGQLRKVYRFDYRRGELGVSLLRNPEQKPAILTYYRPCMVGGGPEDRLPESAAEPARVKRAAEYFEKKFPNIFTTIDS
jgi:hypothetical protein